MQQHVLKNVRFKAPTDTLAAWEQFNPIIAPGELILVKLEGNRVRVKAGRGVAFKDTSYTYTMEPWSKGLAGAADTSVRPQGSIGKNTEDFIHIYGDIIYPITLTTSVRLTDNTKLQTWMDNVKTNDITMTGSLKIKRPIFTPGLESRDIIKITKDTNIGHDAILGDVGGNLVLSSGESGKRLTTGLPGTEDIFIASDAIIYFYTNMQTSETTTKYMLSNTGFVPVSDNVRHLGGSANRWASIYATTGMFNKVTISPNGTSKCVGVNGTNGNDGWHIGGGCENDYIDSGYLEIATKDNGNEPIYVRQINSADEENPSVRTLTLLDNYGNTIIPGKLYMAPHQNLYFTAVTGTSTTAQGILFRNADAATVFGGVGYYCNSAGVGERLYIGTGVTPWNINNSLSITATAITFRGNKVWYAGNDGSGSGLDADLLDGKHAASFSLTTHEHRSKLIANSTHLDELGFLSNDIYYAPGDNTIVGKPTGVNNFSLQVIRTGNGYVSQILISTTKVATSQQQDKMFIRTYGALTGETPGWSPWSYFYTSRNKPTLQDIGAAAASHNHDSVYSKLSHTHTPAQSGAAPKDFILKNQIIRASGWVNNVFTISNSGILANHVPQVFFSKPDIGFAGRMNIKVWTEAGKLKLERDNVPDLVNKDLLIEVIIFTPV